ncbi:BrnT family toxin [uncultured Methylobacterium sp.]|jgi:uncharacterized DUF497 family protein|uniref:BrnT family toxin n=1 Tax=uncultured Methylobacterium sp. TaxID=157278 RepID=UPI0026193702|nr:BrnT family toxin [uncultured Methylobacterium sp.]
MDARPEFEWDEGKATVDLARHGVPFYVAVRVFADPDRVEFDMSCDSDGEERRKVVGLIGSRLFSVVFTCRKGRIRPI